MFFIFVPISLISGIIITSVIYAVTGFSLFTGSQKNDVSIDDAAGAELTMLAYSVLEYIKNDDFAALSRVVHPEFGVVFSPYATINLTTDQRFNQEQIALLPADTNSYVWGVYNGSGRPIQLTPAEYFDEFVPAAAHMDAVIIGINSIVRSGNALENMIDVFPNVKFVDFHVPCNESGEELSWSSLRLGFEEYQGNLRLIAVVFSAWSV